jgi:predicted dehydrogenase
MAIEKEARVLRIGVLGCGPIAQIAHFDACHKARNAELYAICDVADDLRERMSLVWEPRVVYSDYAKMLADPQVEAVIIAVADQFHVALAMQAVEAGKHVFIEKPLGISVEECEQLRQSVRDRRLIAQVGNNRRFDPGVVFARQFIGSEIGQRLSFKAWYHDSTYRYTMTDNLQPVVARSVLARRPEGKPKSDRRRYYILGHASHLVDTARMLCGPIVSLRARHLERFGAYCWFISATFDDGSIGHLDLTIAIRGDFEEGFVVYGEHGSVNAHLYLPWFHKSSVVECFSTKDRLYRRPLGEDAYTYKLQLEGFADAILHGKVQHGATVEDGVAAVRALVAISKSAETGKEVRLDQVTGTV